MAKDKKIFVDYGGLICDYQFNRSTLFRAHRLVLNYINSQNHPTLTLDKLAQAHNRAIQAYLTARKDNSEWPMDKIMGLVLSNLGLDGNIHVSELSKIYKLNDHNSVPYPESKPVLKELAERKKLGIISNLPHDSLIYELKGSGLYNLFETITISYEIGYRKPHPVIYQEALRRANVTADKSFFISHDQEEVEGAEKLGIESFLVKSLKEVKGFL